MSRTGIPVRRRSVRRFGDVVTDGREWTALRLRHIVLSKRGPAMLKIVGNINLIILIVAGLA